MTTDIPFLVRQPSPRVGFDVVLRRVAGAKRLTICAIADRSDYDRSHLHRLAHGQRQPTRGAVLAIAEALGATDQERDDLLTAAEFTTDAALAALTERYRP